MALVLGTNVGFVTSVPTADPAGADTTIDGSSVVVKHTSPATAYRITQIGWYRGSGTNTSNFEIALYADTSNIAAARLYVDTTNSSSTQGWINTAVDWAISGSTNYWLAVQMDAHSGSSYIDSATSGGAGIDIRTSQSTLANPYGGGAVSDADGMYAIYALVELASAPTVTTQNCSGITITGCTGNGNITATGGPNATRRGFCFMTGTSGDPTTANSVAYDDGSYGTGAYTKAITGLSGGTNYRVRAYAVNTAGTSYGTTVQLLTQQAPTVALNSPADNSSGSDTTPTLNFTGTDINSADTLEYEVQVDTVNTFDSQAGSPAVVDFLDETGFAWDGHALYGANYTKIGQAFTPSSSGNLTSVRFYFYNDGSPTGTVVAKLYAITGTYGTDAIPTGSALATSDNFDASTVTALGFYEFTFSGANQYAMTASNHYAIEIEYSGGDASNYLNYCLITGGTAHGGNLFGYAGAYYTYSSEDSIFYVYASPAGPLIDAVSTTDAGFTAGHPFASGAAKEYTVQSALTDDTYYWRVRAKDPSGTNTYGAWISVWSFTVSTAMGFPIKYWTGSAFSIKPLKYYTGSTWATKPVKRYNGTTWDTLSN